jgi:hypothetical protein
MKKGECVFMGDIEKFTGILTQAAGELDNLAKSFETSDEELAELNAGKTQEEIDLEDAAAAEIAAPFVNALDSVTDIINEAAAKIAKMSEGTFDEGEETGGFDMGASGEEEQETEAGDFGGYAGFDEMVDKMYELGKNLQEDAVMRLMLQTPDVPADADDDVKEG